MDEQFDSGSQPQGSCRECGATYWRNWDGQGDWVEVSHQDGCSYKAEDTLPVRPPELPAKEIRMKNFKATRYNINFVDGSIHKNVTTATFESLNRRIPNEIASFEKFEIELPDPLADPISHEGDARADYIRGDAR